MFALLIENQEKVVCSEMQPTYTVRFSGEGFFRGQQ